MIALTKVKQNLSVCVVRDGKTTTQMIAPGQPGFTEVVLPSHEVLQNLGMLEIIEVNDSIVPEMPKQEDSHPTEEPESSVKVTIKKKRREKSDE